MEVEAELLAARPHVPHALRHRSDRARLGGVGRASASSASTACSRSRSGIAQARQLFLARDRLGVKPLYYAVLPDGRSCSARSSRRCWCIPTVPRRIDPQAVEEYFAFGYVPDPKTIYRDVKKLEPGAYICVQPRRREASSRCATGTCRCSGERSPGAAPAVGSGAARAPAGSRAQATGVRRAARRVPVGRHRFERRRRDDARDRRRARS